jgi:hypothetical protein
VPLGFRIHAAGGLVEDQDPRVMQDRPRDRDPLPLAPAQRLAPLAHHGVVPVGEPDDEVVRVGRPRRVDHLVQRGLRLTIADVLQHGAVEQVRIL